VSASLPIRHFPLALALLLSLAFGVPHAFAARAPGALERLSTARAIAPAAGERRVASDVRFAFDLPANAKDPVLLVARRAFDPAGWSAVPAGEEWLVAAPHARPGMTLAEAGVAVDADTPLWWAVATRDAATGALRVSEPRAFTALRRFANRVAPSPWVLAERRGAIAPERLAALRAEAAAARAEALAGLAAGAAPARAEGGASRPRIRLAAGYDFAPAEALPEVPAHLSAARMPRAEGTGALEAVLVQFAAPPGDAERAALAAAGGVVFAYVPDQAYLVRVAPGARAALAAVSPGAWIGDWQPAYKLSPRIASEAGADDFDALLFPDADVAVVRAALLAAGAQVTAITDNGVNRIARFRVDRAALPVLAALHEVAWIEPVARFTVDNSNAQWVVQTGVSANRRVWDQGIRGQGQIVMTSDSGVNTGHNQFRDPAVPLSAFGDYATHRKVIAYKNGSLNPSVAFGDHGSYHGSHTAGTLLGADDPLAADARDGMAKEAKLYFMDISGSALGTGVDPFPDLNDLFAPSYAGNAAGAARVSSNSWGASVQGAYTLNSMAVDQFAWNHPDYFIAFSNGNSGAIGTVGAPASAKNAAGVGGTGNGTSQTALYTSTSRGPTADGRRKPLFCAPGASVSSSTSGVSTYGTLSGTSMASPAATGAVVLMRQYLTDGWYPTGAPVPANGFTPSAALLRAMAVNSAVNGVTGFTAPDNNVGWGRVNADEVLYFAGDARKLLLVDHTEGLAHGEFVEYQVQVTDGSIPLEVSLAWTDFPGSPAAAIQLVNDLNLTVSNGALVYKGSVFSGGNSVTGGSYDALNVEENVRVAVPAPGLWTVRVEAPSVPMGPQPFALCVTGGVGNGAAALALDRATYGSSSTVEIQVIDADAVPPVQVTMTSPTEGAETVTLAGGNGVWSATLPLTPASPAPSNGELSVSNGDALVATYFDATTAVTLEADATVNFDTPIITNVRATPLGTAGTLIEWDTDRSATSRVYVGATPALELGAVDSSGYAIAHRVLVTGLAPGQSYYYDVESVGLSGGVARDDLGGAHHRFTTTGKGDVLLVMEDAAFPHRATWEEALAALGYAVDVWDGDLAAAPAVGDTASGLRAYKAVLWQVGRDTYPPFSATQRAALDSLLGAGGRLLVVGHDIGWGLATPSAPGYTAAGAAWLEQTLKARFVSDPSTWTSNLGFAGDPVSGAWTGGVPYEPFGSLLAGDGIRVAPGTTGTAAYVWKNDDVPFDTTAIRWESAGPLGSPANATWGGQPSRLVYYAFEWARMAPPLDVPDATRTAVLGGTVAWLLGRTPPAVTVTAPNGGESVTAGTLDVTWTESAAAGFAIASRTIEASFDGGSSWSTVAAGVGPSPYTWDLTGVANAAAALVRVRVADDGTPALTGTDESDGAFALARAASDAVGPVVVAGSIQVSPNPLVRPGAGTVLARVSDAGTGGATVAGAEWSIGETPAAAGTGTPLGSTFDSTTVNVSGALDLTNVFVGVRKVWVRGRDAAGNWGPAAHLAVLVNGTDPVAVGDRPASTFLAPAAPNPFAGSVTLRFGLARAGDVSLDVFDPQGRRVRRLAGGAMSPGLHAIEWDGRDTAGGRARPGVYLVRLAHPDGAIERRIVALE